jgi:hypothetical protein
MEKRLLNFLAVLLLITSSANAQPLCGIKRSQTCNFNYPSNPSEEDDETPLSTSSNSSEDDPSDDEDQPHTKKSQALNSNDYSSNSPEDKYKNEVFKSIFPEHPAPKKTGRAETVSRFYYNPSVLLPDSPLIPVSDE